MDIFPEDEHAIYIDPKMKDIIEDLHQTFIREGDAQYLDTAIEMATELASLDKSIEPTLNHLLEVRGGGIAVPEIDVENNCETNGSATPDTELETNVLVEKACNQSPDTEGPSPDEMGDDTVELFRNFYNMFVATRETIYLDNALGLHVVEGLNVIDESIAADVERLRIVRNP